MLNKQKKNRKLKYRNKGGASKRHKVMKQGKVNCKS